MESATAVLLTVPEAARALRLSRSTIYSLLATGRLRSVRVGASRRIQVQALEAFVAQLRDEADADT